MRWRGVLRCVKAMYLSTAFSRHSSVHSDIRNVGEPTMPLSRRFGTVRSQKARVQQYRLLHGHRGGARSFDRLESHLEGTVEGGVAADKA